MTQQSDNGASQTIDHEASFARIRAELADLDAVIDDLRTEADRLLSVASGRITVAALVTADPVDSDPGAGQPVDESAFGVVEADGGEVVAPVGAGQPVEESAFGVVEADGGEVVAPVGAGQPVEESAFGVVEADGGEVVAPVEPAAEAVVEPLENDEDAELPPIDEATREPLAEVVDETVLGGPAAPAPPEPIDYGEAASDDGAFERFFSDEVEPEPAQRWLLDG